jgi:hypothetical protein
MRAAFWILLLFPGIQVALRIIDWLATLPLAICLPASAIVIILIFGGIISRISRHV